MSEQEPERWWVYGSYTGEACPKCSRLRVMSCEDGSGRERAICEKCLWEPAVGEYCAEAAR